MWCQQQKVVRLFIRLIFPSFSHRKIFITQCEEKFEPLFLRQKGNLHCSHVSSKSHKLQSAVVYLFMCLLFRFFHIRWRWRRGWGSRTQNHTLNNLLRLIWWFSYGKRLRVRRRKQKEATIWRRMGCKVRNKLKLDLSLIIWDGYIECESIKLRWLIVTEKDSGLLLTRMVLVI